MLEGIYVTTMGGDEKLIEMSYIGNLRLSLKYFCKILILLMRRKNDVFRKILMQKFRISAKQ